MSDYLDKLAEIKKNMKKPAVKNRWSDAEVYELLEKGDTALHTKHSCADEMDETGANYTE